MIISPVHIGAFTYYFISDGYILDSSLLYKYFLSKTIKHKRLKLKVNVL